MVESWEPVTTCGSCKHDGHSLFQPKSLTHLSKDPHKIRDNKIEPQNAMGRQILYN